MKHAFYILMFISLIFLSESYDAPIQTDSTLSGPIELCNIKCICVDVLNDPINIDMYFNNICKEYFYVAAGFNIIIQQKIIEKNELDNLLKIIKMLKVKIMFDVKSIDVLYKYLPYLVNFLNLSVLKLLHEILIEHIKIIERPGIEPYPILKEYLVRCDLSLIRDLNIFPKEDIENEAEDNNQKMSEIILKLKNGISNISSGNFIGNPKEYMNTLKRSLFESKNIICMSYYIQISVLSIIYQLKGIHSTYYGLLPFYKPTITIIKSIIESIKSLLLFNINIKERIKFYSRNHKKRNQLSLVSKNTDYKFILLLNRKYNEIRSTVASLNDILRNILKEGKDDLPQDDELINHIEDKFYLSIIIGIKNHLISGVDIIYSDEENILSLMGNCNLSTIDILISIFYYSNYYNYWFLNTNYIFNFLYVFGITKEEFLENFKYIKIYAFYKNKKLFLFADTNDTKFNLKYINILTNQCLQNLENLIEIIKYSDTQILNYEYLFVLIYDLISLSNLDLELYFREYRQFFEYLKYFEIRRGPTKYYATSDCCHALTQLKKKLKEIDPLFWDFEFDESEL
ncbi:hypothetical protein TCON_1278 [Astathelohania contejeani]|uniref:Secreted protein n=1 Tax=Astathelohania contejeani TaxID=164912 RepID=A0ABQ7HZB3_9MICR|nr:hypothetical protein TCON_1278 [Thelohania contejeani]